jgi:hypothetical protein
MKRIESITRMRPNIWLNTMVIVLALTVSPLQGATPTSEKDDETKPKCCMTAPFESDLAEAELTVETWMTAPFETDVDEPDLAIESWMTSVF